MGNTVSGSAQGQDLSVHPHARGEHAKQHRRPYGVVGSSPRSWGTPIADRPDSQIGRFIPTLVGNTLLINIHQHFSAVHPHARGEHFCSLIDRLHKVGSSPRSWGTLTDVPISLFCQRFIPTLVGNTARKSAVRSFLTVHPHARGEHSQSMPRAARKHGSSPRSWGTLISGNAGLGHCRFIPTLVGNTTAPPAVPPRVTVHPHARGEH